GALGRDYADRDAFAQAGVLPLFQVYEHPTYPQLHGEFAPYMSVIDLLFNCGDSSLDVLMSGNIGRDGLLTAEAWR
ncbi:MAG: WbqC family protein, partial [Magnetospirillum sp.]|nr:WbqC family protein [Magnetospirillum sp.]